MKTVKKQIIEIVKNSQFFNLFDIENDLINNNNKNNDLLLINDMYILVQTLIDSLQFMKIDNFMKQKEIDNLLINIKDDKKRKDILKETLKQVKIQAKFDLEIISKKLLNIKL